jgi:parvulin-like peptidyl-prolyl isomerase
LKNPAPPGRLCCRAGMLLVLALIVPLASGCGRKIVAKVNGDPIYRDEFVTRTINFRQATPGEAAGLQTLSAMVNEMIVTQEARRENVVPTDKDIDDRLKMIAQQLAPRGQTLEEFLQQSGVTMEAARVEMRNDLARRNLMTKGITVTDAEIQKFYDEHKKEFTTPEQFTIRQITVSTEQDAKDAKTDLKNADFGLVAISRSKDIFKQQGGLVPPFTASPPPGFPVDASVRQVAYRMKEGELSDPIKVGNQWVIVKLEKKEPAKAPTFAEMKEPIREGLMQQKAQQTGKLDQVQQKLVSLRQQAEIEILDEQYRNVPQFQKQPMPSAPGLPGTQGAQPPGEGVPSEPAAPPPGGAPPATGGK